jgi:hypothetical protein
VIAPDEGPGTGVSLVDDPRPSDERGMSSMPMLLTVLVPLFGAAAFVAAFAVRASGQCRHRVAHARVIARARRIEEMRRQQIMHRMHLGYPSSSPGLRDGITGRS